MHPQLKEHGVRLVGVGLEELGVEEFVDGQYFSGGARWVWRVLRGF